jgi:transketolase
MRGFFAACLEKAMHVNQGIVLLYGDIGNRLFDSIKNLYPRRVINCGVSEANMVSVAAGVSKSGLTPVVYTISSFLYLKALEQIKVDLAYGQNKAILVGTGGGLSYAPLGTTHHSLEDVSTLSALPQLSIYLPSDLAELEASFREALNQPSSSWIRIGKKEEFSHSKNVNMSSAHLLEPHLVFGEKTGKRADVHIVSTGMSVRDCISAASLIEASGKSLRVWSMPKLKPLPEMRHLEAIWNCGNLVVVEEHSSQGGLFAMLASRSVQAQMSTRVYAMNTGDLFHTGLGNAENARIKLGLDSASIVKFVSEL